LVPNNFAVGKYRVKYGVRAKGSSRVTDSDDFSVIVLPEVAFDSIIEELPDSVIAGRDYETRIRYINSGNSKVNLRLSVDSVPGYKVNVTPQSVDIDPAQAESFTIKVSTDSKLRKAITNVLNIRAIVEDLKGSRKTFSKTLAVKVIPHISGKVDSYHTIPTSIHYSWAKDDAESGHQLEFSGSGNLDPQGKKKVSFLVRGPDTQNIDPYGQEDEYYLTYQDDT